MARYTRKKLEENPERQIALGMIVSEEFIKNIQPIYVPELIDTPFILTVNGWCLEHWDKFQTCPGVLIEDIYEQKIQEGEITEEEEGLIAQLLDSISTEYERSSNFNSQYLLDRAERYFESQNLKKRIGNIKVALSNNDIDEAQKELKGYKTISRSKSKGVDPFTDIAAMREAFEYSANPLFKLPGAAGEYLNDLFVPDSFVTLLGPEKRGKTWWLIELSIWARRYGNNIAFFSAGDMTLPQMVLRYGIRFTGKSNKAKFCKEGLIPVIDCKFNQDDSCQNKHRVGTFGVLNDKGDLADYENEPDYEPCSYCRKNYNSTAFWKGAYWQKQKAEVEPLTWKEAIEKGELLNRRWGKKSKLKLTEYANSTLTIEGIENQLDMWEREENFIPDVIIVDYMDLLTAEHINGGMQQRHVINDIWGGARRLSQQRHCCFISASQSDAVSYDAKWIGMKHFSEAKAKNAHVTGMVTLNQTMEEKKRGIMRLGKLLTREDEFDSLSGVTVLQSIRNGKTLLDSYY